MKKDYLQIKGVVTKTLPNTKFKVLLENNSEITCTISGKIRINHIKILEADEVLVEISIYDLTNGRIVRRL